MTDILLQNGSEIADDSHVASDQRALVAVPVKATGDLLTILQKNPPRSFAMLRTTCGLLGAYLDQPSDQIFFDTVNSRKGGFRQFLASRRYAENSIRAYAFQQRVLLKTARRFGWDADDAASDEWRALLVPAAKIQLLQMVRHFSRISSTPADMTIEAVERWGQSRIQDGASYAFVAKKKNQFWRLLRNAGCTRLKPPSLMKQEKYGCRSSSLQLASEPKPKHY